jgi:hypothetical protein
MLSQLDRIAELPARVVPSAKLARGTDSALSCQRCKTASLDESARTVADTRGHLRALALYKIAADNTGQTEHGDHKG